jgi:RNA polymerase sigma-70 factor (ECF subfamily)
VTFPDDGTIRLEPIIDRARSGDPDAFATIYDLYAVGVYRFALAHVPEPADAEDVVQRVFLKVIEALPGYENRGIPFGAWLFRIARNTVIDFGRTRRPVTRLEAVIHHRDMTPGPSELTEVMADRAAIREAMGTLTRDQRDVILFRFFAGLTHAEIGVLLGKPENAIRGLQFRAIATLRRRLDNPPRTSPERGRATT